MLPDDGLLAARLFETGMQGGVTPFASGQDAERLAVVFKVGKDVSLAAWVF
jgi:hypothetical protein